MSRILAALYDFLTEPTEEACLSRWRDEILGDVKGSVLDLGAGTGRNLEHVPPDVDALTLVEPDRHMRRRLRGKLSSDRPARFPVRTVGAVGSLLPFRDEAFDVVVVTLVLCSVEDEAVVLEEIGRVLRPGGELRFLEHVAAEPGTRRSRWQRALEPFWKRLAGNCHLTRRTLESIGLAGFEVLEARAASMRRAPPVVRPTIRGRAVIGGRGTEKPPRKASRGS